MKYHTTLFGLACLGLTLSAQLVAAQSKASSESRMVKLADANIEYFNQGQGDVGCFYLAPE